MQKKGFEPPMSENSSINTEKKLLTSSVCTLILNYNNYSDTIETIESVLSLEYDANSVLLVENSSDNTIIQKIRTRFPDLAIIENKKNLGYAGGNNSGIQKAIASGAEYIFLLNNDVKLEKDVLKKCISAMEKSPGCGACQPIIATFENKEMVWSAGTQLYFGYPRLYLKGTQLQKNGIIPSPFGLVGCAILFRRSALQQTGLFDESLFLLHEETDWCIRAKKMNFSLLIISDAVVYHKISVSIGMFSKIYLYYIGRNWLLVGKKNFSFFYYLYILITEFLIRFPYYLYHVTKKGQIGMIKFYLKGIFDGILGISGEAKL
jgi:GT2 family glycosyltransferase